MDSHDREPITRRRAVGLLGTAFGGGLLAGAGLLEAAVRGDARPVVGIPPAIEPLTQAPIIRTLGGDLSPDALGDGALLFHEHLSMHYPLGAETHFTDDVELMVEEVRLAAADGVSLIVDAGHPDMQRSLSALQRIDRESGLPIVASGGYYRQSYYPADIATRSAEEIALGLAEEASRDRLGAFGEIGQQEGELTADETKVFEAVGMAQAATGLPVFTHNEYTLRATDVPRDAGIRQLDILESAGAEASKVLIGHVCCLDDPDVEIASEIASRGAYVGFDRVTLNFTMPDENRVAMAMALAEAGHADRLLLSSDLFLASSLKSEGGPGIAQAVTVFAPMLRAAGMDEDTLHMILVENPKRFLSFVPRG